jgi:hypothetical protein
MDEQNLNRYAPPSIPLAEQASEVGTDGYLGEPQAVGIGRAIGWLRDAWNLFKQRPGKWMGAVLLICIINFALALPPFGIGMLLQPLAMTFLPAGIAYASQGVEQLGDFNIGDIFLTGFWKSGKSLLGAGLFGLMLTMLYGVLMVILFGNDAMQAYIHGHEGVPSAMRILTLGFAIIYWALNFLTPTLIILQGEKLFRAIGLSLKGFLRNIGGAFWCSLLMFLAFLGVIFSGAVLIGFLSSLAPALGKAALVVLVIAVLACLPVLFILPYAVYRDLFFERE